ncbi:polysaccharide pyruvyl transferase family protein [bacterium]|jgi:hypothetical protein|nr:polysaccharide pyruvyl transferase family protein [bacterium]
MKIPNILFSTTRQWNPGDEWIRFGIERLLKEVIGDFNPIIYNRNPQIRASESVLNPLHRLKHPGFIQNRGILEAILQIGFWDNSFKPGQSGDWIDLVVFAGTPEWEGPRNRSLHKLINKYNIPTIFLGIGNSAPLSFDKLSKAVKNSLKNAELLTLRSEATVPSFPIENMRSQAQFIPCPALLSSPTEKKYEKSETIGLVFATDKAVDSNRVPPKTARHLHDLYRACIKKYSCELICHYIDELPEAARLFPDVPIRYSYDAGAYFDIYRSMDAVVSARVHGIGIAASLGIPGLSIGHDHRADTTKGFLSDSINVFDSLENLMAQVDKFIDKCPEQHLRLVKHKNATYLKYISILKNTDIIKQLRG